MDHKIIVAFGETDWLETIQIETALRWNICLKDYITFANGVFFNQALYISMVSFTLSEKLMLGKIGILENHICAIWPLKIQNTKYKVQKNVQSITYFSPSVTGLRTTPVLTDGATMVFVCSSITSPWEVIASTVDCVDKPRQHRISLSLLLLVSDTLFTSTSAHGMTCFIWVPSSGQINVSVDNTAYEHVVCFCSAAVSMDFDDDLIRGGSYKKNIHNHSCGALSFAEANNHFTTIQYNFIDLRHRNSLLVRLRDSDACYSQ